MGETYRRLRGLEASGLTEGGGNLRAVQEDLGTIVSSEVDLQLDVARNCALWNVEVNRVLVITHGNAIARSR